MAFGNVYTCELFHKYVLSIDAYPKIKMLTPNNNTIGAYQPQDLSYQTMYPTCIPSRKKRPRAGV